MSEDRPLPVAKPETGKAVLKGLIQHRSLLTAMEIMQHDMGPAFQITLPGFQPAVFVGPQSNRQIMVSKRSHFRWRSPSDPVTKLLRHGLLVEDGDQHAGLRGHMEPLMQKPSIVHYIPAMQTYTDRVTSSWSHGSVQDMLIEMRRVALLIFMGTLLDVEFGPDLEAMWKPILRTLKYISPGLWIVWPNMPRPGYGRALAQMDDYLYRIIRLRRQRLKTQRQMVAGKEAVESSTDSPTDLLSHLASIPTMTDDLIRDQILTMLIAGHDTSTALLAWALHLLANNHRAFSEAQAEVDAVAGQDSLTLAHLNNLNFLDRVIKETMRLYPPIHVANRLVARDTAVAGYELKTGTRLMASIYLSHRDPQFWEEPEAFRPERFERRAAKPPPLTYVPFGAGPRACIGATFAQIESKVILARILQQFDLNDTGRHVKPAMGATLEPHPGVFLRVSRRQHGQVA